MVDYAFLDATFYDGEEINTRDISQIPHPFVIESMGLFSSLSESERQKIHFIHFNHTNPLLNTENHKTKSVIKRGFSVAKKGQHFNL
jgi:pyrroloquinoline quinone biosynthesis protein B